MRVTGGRDKDRINIKLNDYENLVLTSFYDYDHYSTIEKVREDMRVRIIMPKKPQSIYERFDEYTKVSQFVTY